MHIERVIEIIAHIYSHRDYRIPVELYKSQNAYRGRNRDQSIHVERAIEIIAHEYSAHLHFTILLEYFVYE